MNRIKAAMQRLAFRSKQRSSCHRAGSGLESVLKALLLHRLLLGLSWVCLLVEASAQAACVLGYFAFEAKCILHLLSARTQVVINCRSALGEALPPLRVLIPCSGPSDAYVWSPRPVPPSPVPASAVLCPRELLTLEVLCSKLIQLTVRVLEQRLLDWDLQDQNTRVSWGDRSQRPMLQASQKTTSSQYLAGSTEE